MIKLRATTVCNDEWKSLEEIYEMRTEELGNVMLSFSVWESEDLPSLGWETRTGRYETVQWSDCANLLERQGASFYKVEFVYFSQWRQRSRSLLIEFCSKTTRLEFRRLDFDQFWLLFYWEDFQKSFTEAARSVTSVALESGQVGPEGAHKMWSVFTSLEHIREFRVDIGLGGYDPLQNFSRSFFESLRCCHTLECLSIGRESPELHIHFDKIGGLLVSVPLKQLRLCLEEPGTPDDIEVLCDCMADAKCQLETVDIGPFVGCPSPEQLSVLVGKMVKLREVRVEGIFQTFEGEWDGYSFSQGEWLQTYYDSVITSKMEWMPIANIGLRERVESTFHEGYIRKDMWNIIRSNNMQKYWDCILEEQREGLDEEGDHQVDGRPFNWLWYEVSLMTICVFNLNRFERTYFPKGAIGEHPPWYILFEVTRHFGSRNCTELEMEVSCRNLTFWLLHMYAQEQCEQEE